MKALPAALLGAAGITAGLLGIALSPVSSARPAPVPPTVVLVPTPTPAANPPAPAGTPGRASAVQQQVNALIRQFTMSTDVAERRRLLAQITALAASTPGVVTPALTG